MGNGILEIAAVALVLSIVGVGALWRRSRATACPKHNRWAGRIGVVLAWLSLIVGVSLLGYAAVLYRTNSESVSPALQDGETQDVKPISSRIADWFDRWTGREQLPYRRPSLTAPEAEKVVDRLIGMGYLKFVPDQQRADVRLQLVATAINGYLDSTWNDEGVAADLRTYPADNEDLAEGQVGATILLMKPVLEREGAKLDTVVDDFGDERYQVFINGQQHLIYEGGGGKDSWSLALKRLLEIVNGLLEEAGSSERLYGIYGGNDGRVILLTPEMHDYIESLGDVLDSGWMPYSVEELAAGERR